MSLSQALADAVWLLRHEPEQYPEALRRLDAITDRLAEVERSRQRRPPLVGMYRPMLGVIEGGKA